MKLKLKLFLTTMLIAFCLPAIAQQNLEIQKGKIRLKIQKSSAFQFQHLPQIMDALPADGFVKTGLSEFDGVNKLFKAVKIKRVFPFAGKFEARHIKHGLHLWYEISFEDSKTDIFSCLEKYKKLSSVDITEAIYNKRFVDTESTQASVNDPMFGDQWHYQNTGQTGGTPGADINLTAAWDIETGSDDVIVSIVDGGIDINHEDLRGNLWVNEAEYNGTAGVDDDGNGYVDDIHGYGFVNSSGTIIPHYHGVHVSGTIGAVNNNGVGVSGIAGGSGSNDGVRLMSCAVFSSSGAGGFAQAYVYAADNGAVISQNSWGYTMPGNYEQSVLDAIDYFIDNAGYDADGNPIGPMQGGIVIFAAGNDGSNSQHYPGYYEPVMAVAATDHNDRKASFSNYGTWVDIAAPGVDVLSTYPNDSYNTISGTSMACPHVSGVAALIVSRFGGIGYAPEMVWARLTETTDNIDAINPSYAGLIGTGRLNAFNAMQVDDGIAPFPISDLVVAGTDVIDVTLQWTATGDSEDTGTATLYDLRYATFPIDENNFNSATRVTNVIRPAIAGTPEEFEVSQLTPNTTYYFAIKAADYFGNYSLISNVVSTTTLPAPQIEVTPSELYETLDSGDSAVQSFTIRNIGDGVLEFNIPGYDVSAADVNVQVNPDDYVELAKGEADMRQGPPVLQGSGDDGQNGYGYKWIDSNQPGGPVFNWNDISSVGTRVNLSDDSYVSVPMSFGFPFYGNEKHTLYISSNGLVGFSSSSISAYSNKPIPYSSSPNGIIAGFWDDLYPSGGAIYYFDNGNEFIVQYTNVPPYSGSGSATFQIILNANGEILFQYLTMTNTLTSATVGIEDDLGTDGMQIAYNTSYIENSLAVLITEQGDFLQDIDPLSGSIASGQSVTVDVEFNAKDLEPGDYSKYIGIYSNDPLNPVTNLPAFLHVNGIPQIGVSENSLDFGEVFINNSESLLLTITNTGTDDLTISSIISDNPFSIVFDSEIILGRGTSIDKDIQFSPTELGSFTGSLTINSNASSDPVLTLALSGSGVLAPEMTISPDSVPVTVYSGDIAHTDLFIQNLTGGSSLFWELTIQNPKVESFSRDRSNDIIRTDLLPTEYADKNISVTPSPDAFEMPYLETFENGNLDDWFFDGTSGTRQVVSGIAASGSKSFYYDSETLGHFHGIHQEFINGTQPKFISFYVRSGSSSLSDAYAVFRTGSYSLIWFFAHENGSFYVNNDVGGDNTYPYNPLQWYHIEFRDIDWVDKDFDYYVDDELVKADVPFRNASYVSDIDIVHLYNYDSGADAWWDDIYVGEEPPKSWLSADPLQGSVTAGNQEAVDLKIDATNLIGGEYDANVFISSNDPDVQEFRVPVHLEVIDAPGIQCTPMELDFGEVFINGSGSMILQITNTGSQTLEISSIDLDNSFFSCGTGPLTLEPQESYSLPVSFSPLAEGEQIGTLSLFSNDTNDAQLDVSLSGTGVLGPLMTVDPKVFDVQLFTNETAVETVTISNSGFADLEFEVTFSETSGDNFTVNSEYVEKIIIDENEYLQKNSEIQNSQNIDGEADEAALAFPFVNFQTPIISDTGGKVLWDFTHGSTSSNYSPTSAFSSLANMLENMGFVNEITSSGITNLNLSEYDVIIIQLGGALYSQYSSDEADAIEEYVNRGGGLLIIGDDPTDPNYNINPVSQRFGVTCGLSGSTESPITNFSDDPVFENVTSLNTGTPGFLTANAPGEIIAYSYSYGIIAKAELGLGNVIILGDLEFATNTNFGSSSYSNAIFMENVFEYLDGGLSWLVVDPLLGTISGNNSENIQLNFTAGSLAGDYYAEIYITGNDPVNTCDTVMVHLDVVGVPDIEYAPSSLDFGEVYVQSVETKTVQVSNSGTDELVISSLSVDNATFACEIETLSLAVGESYDLDVQFSPQADGSVSGTLTLETNDNDESTVIIPLVGVGILPPSMEVDPDHLSFNIAWGDSAESVITISNMTGQSDLTYTVEVGESSILATSEAFTSDDIITDKSEDINTKAVDSEDVFIQKPVLEGYLNKVAPSAGNDLSDILEILTDSLQDVADLVPNRYNFSYGITGNYISDGGNDMYDGGNYLSTSLGSNLNYSNGIISASSYLGANGQYFTLKVTGMFAFVADIENIDYFEITGNLGADGSGSVNGAILEHSSKGKTYLGFVKRVYGTSDPSVNHLIIVERNNDLQHEFPTNTNYDDHSVTGLNNSDRIYYLLYAGYSGYYIDDDNAMNIMTHFIELVNTSSWLSTVPGHGEIVAGDSETILVKANAKNLDIGEYTENIIISGNDPLNIADTVEVSLTVYGVPDIEAVNDPVTFNTCFVSEQNSSDAIVINQGNDDLVISEVIIEDPNFSTTFQGATLAPGESVNIEVVFQPLSAGEHFGFLHVNSNDPDEALISISLIGKAFNPPVMSIDPDAFDISSPPFELIERTATITNSGGYSLEFDVSVNEGQAPEINVNSPFVKTILIDEEEYEMNNKFIQPATINSNGEVEGIAPFKNVMPHSTGNGGKVLWDITHGLRSSTYEPSSYYSSFVNLMENMGYENEVTDAGITNIDLSGYDIVIIALYSSYYSAYTSAEVSALEQFVQNGGGLFVMADDYADPNANINPVTQQFGITCGLSPNVGSSITDFSEHPLFEGVNTIYYNVGGALSISGNAEAIAWYSGSPAIAMSELNRGKVLVVGEFGFASNTYFASYDNAIFLENVVNYLDSEEGFWLSVTPQSGHVFENQSEELQLSINTDGLFPGDYYAHVIVSGNDPVNTADTIDVHLEIIGEMQTISLNQGWNLLSTYIIPYDNSCGGLIEASGMETKLEVIKDETGGAYYPSLSFGTFSTFDIGEGYLVKTITGDDFNVFGAVVEPQDVEMQLNQGWNIIGYLYQQPELIVDMIGQIYGSVEIIKDETGAAYYPPLNFGTFNMLEPGEGYQIKLIVNELFTYPEGSSKSGPGKIMRPEKTEYFAAPVNTGSNMTLIIPEYAWRAPIDNGDEIAVYSPTGKLVGAAVLKNTHNLLPVFGNDYSTTDIDGLETGGSFIIKLWKKSTGKTYVLPVEMWEKGSQAYQKDGIAVIGQFAQAVSGVDEMSGKLPVAAQLMPNPVSTHAFVSFNVNRMQEVSIDIYNALGEKVLIVANNHLYPAGNHKVNCDVEHLKPGMYTCKLTVGSTVKTLKFVKQ